jgi:hypothetical protein
VGKSNYFFLLRDVAFWRMLISSVMNFAPRHYMSLRDFFSSFLLLVQKKRSKEKDPRAEAFLQLTLQNHSKQPKSGPRLPAFLTVTSPYAGTSGGFPAAPEYGFKSSLNIV